MKLYYSKGACSLVIRIIINEIGINAQFESVNLKTKKTEKGIDFLTINPKGAVPTLELENGEVLTENAVILQYLADSTNSVQLLPPIDNFNRYHTLEWLNYISTELHKNFSPLFNSVINQTVKDQIFIPLIKSKLNYINNRLQHHDYLLGEYFTLPDAYLFVILTWCVSMNLELSEWKNLERYFANLNNRKSIQYSLKQEKEVS